MKPTDRVEFDINIIKKTIRTGRITHLRDGWVTIEPDELLPEEWVTTRRLREKVKLIAIRGKSGLHEDVEDE